MKWDNIAGLTQAGRLFELVVEASPSGMIVVDEVGRLVLVNSQIEKMFGYTRGELLGQPVDVLVPVRLREDHSGYRTDFFANLKSRACMGEGQLLMGAGRDLYGLRKDGTEIPVEIGLTPIPTEMGSVVLAAIIDISERKRSEKMATQHIEALQQSHDRAQSVLENALDAVISMDSSGRVTGWNRQAEFIFGWSREEAIGQPLADTIIPVHYRDGHHRGLAHFLATGEHTVLNKHIEITAVRKSGQEFPVELTITPVWIEGKVSFTAFVRDISERRRAAEELRKAHDELEQRVQERTAELGYLNDALRIEIHERQRAEEASLTTARQAAESENKWRQLVQTAPDVITSIDRAGTILFINRAVAGAKHVNELIGTSCYRWVHPDQHELFRSTVEQVFETGEPSSYEVAAAGPDGIMRWWSSHFGPVQVDGRVVSVTIISTDITARRQAEENLRQLSMELARSNAELEQFAYVASHDLQEPLRKVQAFGDMLVSLCGSSLSDEARDYLRRMQNAAKRMGALINDLLAYSRVTTQAQPFAPVDLTEVANEVLSDLEARVHESAAAVEIGSLPTIDADALQMRQLLQNLVGNALKYRRPNVPPVVKVSASIEHPEDGASVCELRVEDNGIGFDEKYRDRIFAPFQRLHGRGQYEGTGMGLAICQKIVERHRGTITARSTPGEGSRFIVRLPLHRG